METVKPKPCDISVYKENYEIIYECPMCECSLRLLGRRQNYCYKCGTKFDWNNFTDYLTKEQSNKYDNIFEQYENYKINYIEYKKQMQSLLDEICKGE